MGVLGTAISILLAFKNNSAYERWWEARRLWGGLVNESRTLAREVQTLPVPASREAAWVRRVVRRQIAFAHALRLHLRERGEPDALKPFLPAEEVERLAEVPNVPDALLQTQAREIAEARDRAEIDAVGQLLLDQTLARVTDILGGCERIKRTPFPRQYDDFAQVIVWAFCLTFPFSLVRELGFWTIPATIMVAFAFQLLEGVGRNIQDPFEGSIHDTPMAALCRTIERDLRHALGETDLPEPLAPRRGVLM
jgi:putative membrane protein